MGPVMTAKITPARAGCWIDEIHGWETHVIVAELAMNLGWLKGRNRKDTMHQRGEIRAIIRATGTAARRPDSAELRSRTCPAR